MGNVVLSNASVAMCLWKEVQSENICKLFMKDLEHVMCSLGDMEQAGQYIHDDIKQWEE